MLICIFCLADKDLFNEYQEFVASIKRYPTELSSSQIARLTGSTKNTVEAIRNGTYREAILEAKSPMDVGLCTYKDLEKTLNRTRTKKDTSES